MEDYIKSELELKVLNRLSRASGCISQGGGYATDKFGDVFIKFNEIEEAKLMFDGEFASLDAICETDTICVPKPLKVFKYGRKCCIITDFLNMNGERRPTELGRKLAKLHFHNGDLLSWTEKRSSFVDRKENEPVATTQFGFHTVTSCGRIAQVNDWSDDWVAFFSQNRLKVQVDQLLKKHGDRDLLELWPKLERKISSYFSDIAKIVPSLVHGDLWFGNYSYIQEGPVIFDPASFYAHNEYEMGIMQMFGGFSKEVYQSYYEVLPMQSGCRDRIKLYELFHYLNHWNHFGSSYRESTISLMRSLA